MRHLFSSRMLLAVALLLGAVAALRAAGANIKLCMKDGSYQMVSSYEVRGDRVRYFSVERSQWEEVPVSLVDFDATRRAQQEAEADARKHIEKAREIEQERFYKPPNVGMEVAPGIRLPGDDGVFTVDSHRLVRLVQSSATLVTDKKRAAMVLALPLPVVRNRSLVILDGAKAAVRLNDPLPVFYVQAGDGLGLRLALVRLKPGKEARVVEAVEASRRGTSATREDRTTVPVERKQMAPNLYALKPTQPLEPGEYALGELLGEKLNLDLWDFEYRKEESAK